MLQNYFKIAIRNLLKYKGYTAVNVFGLTIGIASCILIFIYVQDELSYDKFHEKAGRIYRVHNVLHLPGGEYPYPTATSALPAAMQRDVPGVENYTRFLKFNGGVFGTEPVVKVGDTYYPEKKFLVADHTVFNVFSFPLRRGDPRTALVEPFSIVLTDATARKYFGSADPMGRSLTIRGDSDQVFKVTGLLAEVPANSHVRFDALASMSTFKNINPDGEFLNSWDGDGFYSYVVLAPGKQMSQVERQMMALFRQNVDAERQRLVSYSLMPLTDIHLRSNLRNELEPNSTEWSVYLFTAVAFFILLIASINYMNLATARSAKRAREVGMRKVMGASRRQLVYQFLSESVVLTLLATVLSLAVSWALLPVFNEVSGKTLRLDLPGNPPLLAVLAGVLLFVGFVSGSYPALFLSALQPIATLKGKLKAGMNSSVALRQGLVVFQFAISVMLIIGTFVVFRQLHFLRNKNLGFTKEHVLVLQNPNNALTARLNTFKAELAKHNGVEAVTASFSVPGGLRPITFVRTETLPNEKNLNLAGINVDFDYLKAMNIRLVLGRNFEPGRPGDSTEAVIINRVAAKELNLGPNPIDKVIEVNAGGPDEFRKMRVIGMVENINFEPLQRKTESTFFAPLFPAYNYIFVRISPENAEASIEHVRRTWDRFVEGRPFTYTFLDDSLNQLYQAEQRLSTVVIYFAVLAVAIACLGLFGLASFVTEQRTKEIGVRKVMGASVGAILWLLLLDFIKLLAIANLVALPLAWLGAYKWLQNYSFHIQASWWLFVLPSVLVVTVALLTVGYRTVKAALINPVKSLRSE
jgi:putative ABC transport system permease protein